jgi:hypothetical protein
MPTSMGYLTGEGKKKKPGRKNSDVDYQFEFE